MPRRAAAPASSSTMMACSCSALLTGARVFRRTGLVFLLMSAWQQGMHSGMAEVDAALAATLGALRMRCAACREERLAYYRDWGIGFVARPPDGRAGFVRPGRFKKASNMNFGLDVARAVQALIAVRRRA